MREGYNEISIKMKLEAMVFANGGQNSVKTIQKELRINIDELHRIIEEYNLDNRGLALILDEHKVKMVVSPAVAGFVQDISKSANDTKLSDTALDVLSIIVYKSDATSSEVEYVRGVNSKYTLRNLRIRGLIDRYKDGMQYRYKPTVELLSYLGITNISDIPQYKDVREKLDKIIKEYERES